MRSYSRRQHAVCVRAYMLGQRTCTYTTNPARMLMNVCQVRMVNGTEMYFYEYQVNK